MATSITTNPIEELDFPIVTICPPEGSNTALYHDLVKAGNGSLSEEDKKALKESAFKIFLELSHREYVKRTLATSNKGNVDQVYQGYHSLPKPYFHGTEIRMQSLNGTITTPWYGGEFVEEYYKKDQVYHMVLELPDDIKDQVGNGSLAIELEVDIRGNEGWQERLKYADNAPQEYTWSDFGYAYKLHTQGRHWAEAEAECQKEGGHLASAPSQEVSEELKQVAGFWDNIWLGGKKESGVLSWLDNSTWGYTNWEDTEEGSSGDDFYIRMTISRITHKTSWYSIASTSDYWYPFICQFENPSMTGQEKLELTYKEHQLSFRSFHVWYEYKVPGQQVLDSWEDKRMTGFKLTWRIEKPTLMDNINGEEAKNGNATTSYNNHEKFSDLSRTWLIKTAQLVRHLRIKENMTKEQILGKVVREKSQNISILEEKDFCSYDQIKSDNMDKMFTALVPPIETDGQNESVPEEDVLTGFELYHVILYCPVIDMKLKSFVDHLLSTESIRTIIQSYTNLFHSRVLQGTTSIALAKAFYMDLAATLNLQYGNILLASSTKSQLQAVRDIDGPFFTNNTDLVETCILDSKCDKLEDIIVDRGRMLFLSTHFEINYCRCSEYIKTAICPPHPPSTRQ